MRPDNNTFENKEEKNVKEIQERFHGHIATSTIFFFGFSVTLTIFIYMLNSIADI